jgi:hypothetical protein
LGPGRVRDRSKRLEEGTYALPFNSGNERRAEIGSHELSALLSGIDLSDAKRRKRYRRRQWKSHKDYGLNAFCALCKRVLHLQST